MEFSHCCNAYFHGSAAALPWKAQGLWVPSVNRASTGFLGGSDRQLRLPPCRALARRLRYPRRPLLPLPKNSEGLSGKQELALARKRTTAGCRPLRAMTTSSPDSDCRKAYLPSSTEGTVYGINRAAVSSRGCCRTMQAKGELSAFLLACGRCCNAYSTGAPRRASAFKAYAFPVHIIIKRQERE